jgi:HPt (histidine-containing phosphotransfer) domain-containing protein
MIVNETSQCEGTMLPDHLPPAIDVEVIAGLRALAADGVDILAELTTAFADDGSDRLRKMREAIATGDDVAARRAAHSLKGMSGSLGANHLYALSCEFEKAAPDAMTAASVQLLEQEFQRVSAALNAA